MSEYEMTAFLNDSTEPVETQWFGSTPSDEWVYKLAENTKLGEFQFKSWNGHVHLSFDNGYIEVHKHTDAKFVPTHEKDK